MNFPRTSSQNAGARKPRVLVADDNPVVLARVSTILATSFDLVAAVSDGQRALSAARRLDPDVVVLDVTMPGLNGFQTARELTRSGSRAAIVILTMDHSDEFVRTAMESGAEGFVSKSWMMLDLESAIDHAMAGRHFVPSLTSLLAIAPAPGVGRHAVQFGSSDRAFVSELSGVLAASLQRGDVTVILATDATRAAVAERLIARGCDIASAADQGRYLSLDVTEAVSQVMVDGRLDVGRVAAIVDDFDRSRLAASASCVTVAGEMSSRLCLAGNAEAALQLERAWDDLTRGRPFLTVCFYSLEGFAEGGDSELLSGICARHSAVCHAHGG